jgi:hypothetical protein
MVEQPGTNHTIELAHGARAASGYADGLGSRYPHEREHELRTLTDPRVRERIDELGIEPAGFGV